MAFVHSKTTQASLYVAGPRVLVRVHPAAPDAGRPPIDGWALIDTGAVRTCVDAATARRLGYLPVDFAPVADPSGISAKPVFPVTFELAGSDIPPWRHVSLLGVELADQGLLMLLGRDLLAGGHFIYNGPSGAWCFEFPAPPRPLEKMLPDDRSGRRIRAIVAASARAEASNGQARRRSKRRRKR